MIKAAILDLDGTLLDSMPCWEIVGERYLRAFGYRPRPDLKQALHNLSMHQAARYLQMHYNVARTVDEIVCGFRRINERDYRDNIPLKPYVKPFLRYLKDNSIKLCATTAGERDLALAALTRCGIDGFFSALFTCPELGHGKDEPHIYRRSLAHLGASREETLVFEDALHALQTAKADGFLTVGVYDAYETEQETVRALCDCYITDFRQFRLSAFQKDGAR